LVIDDETASRYAETRERLRARGKPLPENDIWIAALCQQYDRALVTRDGHFLQVEGLVSRAW
jgi:tRNA(fMet)-specific endonuclease VapC